MVRVLIIATILVAALLPAAAIMLCLAMVAMVLAAPASTEERERSVAPVLRTPFRAGLSLRAPPALLA